MPESRHSAQETPPGINLGARERMESGRDASRRGFIRGSSLLLAGALPAAGAAAKSGAGGKEYQGRTLKVGLVGCGYRGIAATSELLSTAVSTVPLQLTAMADAFPDRLQQAFRTLRGRFGDRISAGANSRFVGLRAFEELLASDVDIVLLATPPVFRPVHFEAAVAAGKNVYAETPIATDIPGVDRFQAALCDSQSQRLAVAVGLARHQMSCQASLAQIRQGAIGQILHIQAVHPSVSRKSLTVPRSSSDFQSQLRHWSECDWASGGSLLEQRVRGLDLVNWLMNSHPLEASRLPCNATASDSTGGGSSRDAEPMVEFYYPGGVKLRSTAAPGNRAGIKGALISVHGSTGWCDFTAGKIFNARNEVVWQADEAKSTPLGLRSAAASSATVDGRDALPTHLSGGVCGGLWNEFLNTILARPAGAPVGTTTQAALDSTRTGILGRMAACGTTRVRWDECLGSQ